MNKLIIVSKTHLDLGFTNLASEILDKYLNEFMPKSIEIAKNVNANGKKFVWTVGSWLLKTMLSSGSEVQREKLFDACKRGDIVAHGLPFTTHSELMDIDMMNYGLSIIKDLDKMFGRNTISAKMTDVPGHTKSIIRHLAQNGIKLLHIGVNGASAIPVLPPCFLWKDNEFEIIVIYEASYGGEFRCEAIDDILYFDHSADNHGPRDEKGVINNFNKIKSKYPSYDVVAGTLDDYTKLLLEKKDILPIVTCEIGDSWIHGAATDPYKIAATKELLSLKNKWIYEGTMIRHDSEYNNLLDALLCIAEHTWGLDMKVHFKDYHNYLRHHFDQAKNLDIKIKRGSIYSLKCFKNLALKGEKGIYTQIQKGWDEQRLYINTAIDSLSLPHRAEAEKFLDSLRPREFIEPLQHHYNYNEMLCIGDVSISFNKLGGIQQLKIGDTELIKFNENGILEYHSYGKSDYDFWLKNYTRDYIKTWSWAIGDFCRPRLEKVDKKYKQGRFSYHAESISLNRNNDKIEVLVNLVIDDYCFNNLGASKKAQILYKIFDNSVKFKVIWIDKPASRLTEATFLRIYPNVDKEDVDFIKMGNKINPYDVCKNGNRNLSAVEAIELISNSKKWSIVNKHSPLLGLGKGKILCFDNLYEDISKDGIAYVLHNNVWGTNFPLWYSDNAMFEYEIKF